jgi:hypothetical protein
MMMVAGVENLGHVELPDDREALAFGKRVMHELMQKDGKQYGGITMDITEDERIVGSIAFELDPGRDQNK